MVDDYANSSERGNEEFSKPVPCMIRAYRQGLNDAIGTTEKHCNMTKEQLIDQMISDVLDYFDFDEVHNVMKFLNWKWAMDENIILIEA